ncbi:MAG: addiction module protein [Cyclobacteriaceae bacterium]|nr:addiction module protein [Cyclobacteriaceae bacterium]
MNTQDIQTDKLNLITWITQLQDISLIEKLNKIRATTDEVDFIVPEWHKEIVRQRMADYKNNPRQAVDFDTAMDEIEKDL